MESAVCSLCIRTPAAFLCSCEHQVCTACIGPHMFQSGHSPKPVTSTVTVTTPDHETCTICRNRPASYLCFCRFPYLQLCKSCDLAHYQDSQDNVIHYKHPIHGCKNLLTGSISIQEFTAKQRFLDDLNRQLEEDLVNIENLEEKIETEFEDLITEIKTKKTNLMQKLVPEKENLTRIVKKMQEKIALNRYLSDFKVTSKFDFYLFHGYKENLPVPRVLKLDINREKITTELVKFEVNPEFDEEIEDIPVIKDQRLWVFNRFNMEKTEKTLSRSTTIDRTTAYAYLNSETVICCGGYSRNEVYEVNVRTGETVGVQGMMVARGWQGIWNYRKEWVFVFGGYNGSILSSSEKYNLVTKTWSLLPSDMTTPVHLVSVCEHSSGLYLSGIDDSSSFDYLQLFRPFQQSFTLIRTAPRAVSILCCVGDELYVIKNGTVEVTNLEKEPQNPTFRVKNTFVSQGSHHWMCFAGRQLQGELVGVVHNSIQPTGLFRFDVTRAEFSYHTQFSY